jgi:biopolymer transport protein ExbD
MRKAPQTTLKPISDINLTPLMDLTFILLITFIITFPLIEQGIPVNLPKATTSDITEQKSRTVTVDRVGGLYLDDVPVSADQLRVRLVELRDANPDVSVMVRADESLAYGRVVEVLKMLHAAQIVKMALVTEAEAR